MKQICIHEAKAHTVALDRIRTHSLGSLGWHQTWDPPAFTAKQLKDWHGKTRPSLEGLLMDVNHILDASNHIHKLEGLQSLDAIHFRTPYIALDSHPITGLLLIPLED